MARIYLYKHNGNLAMQSEYADVEKCRAIPGGRWDKSERAWLYPYSRYTMQSITQAWPADQIGMDDEVKPLAEESMKGEVWYDLSGDIPSIPGERIPSRDYQRQAYHFLKDKPAAMLGAIMGAGKTKMAFDWLAARKAERVVVVAPLRVRSVWGEQAPVHSQIPYRVVIPSEHLSSRKRMEEIERGFAAPGPCLAVLNYESVWRDNIADFLKKSPPDAIVCDESHKIKSPGNRAGRFLASLASVVPNRLCLTGTPLHDKPLDIYGQYRFLDPAIFGNSFVRFRDTYACVNNRAGFPQVTGYKNQESLNNNIRKIAYLVGKEVLPQLPETTDTVVQVELGDSVMKTYRELSDEYMSTWGSQGEEVSIVAEHTLSRLLRLQQLTSGYVQTPEGWKEVDTAKYDALCEILEGIDPSESVVVMARFHHDLENIKKAAKSVKRWYHELSGRVDELKDWKEGYPGSVIAVQIQSGSAGVDLTKARYMIYYSLGYSLGDYEQSRARIHRPGQKRPCQYIHLIAKDTVDEQVYKSLQCKEDVIQTILRVRS